VIKSLSDCSDVQPYRPTNQTSKRDFKLPGQWQFVKKGRDRHSFSKGEMRFVAFHVSKMHYFCKKMIILMKTGFERKGI
jgi:hypothetical protein